MDTHEPGPEELCPECGAVMRANPPRRGLAYGLRPGRRVLEQICVRCGLLRVRVLPAHGGQEQGP